MKTFPSIIDTKNYIRMTFTQFIFLIQTSFHAPYHVKIPVNHRINQTHRLVSVVVFDAKFALMKLISLSNDIVTNWFSLKIFFCQVTPFYFQTRGVCCVSDYSVRSQSWN